MSVFHESHLVLCSWAAHLSYLLSYICYYTLNLLARQLGNMFSKQPYCFWKGSILSLLLQESTYKKKPQPKMSSVKNSLNYEKSYDWQWQSKQSSRLMDRVVSYWPENRALLLYCTQEIFDFRFVSCTDINRWKSWTACFYFLVCFRKINYMKWQVFISI